MKLLLFSDIHGDRTACAVIVDKSRSADVAIGAGDFASFRGDLSETISVLSAIDIPTVLVHGNHESLKELSHACRNWRSSYVLHGDSVTISDITIFGIGGAIPITPFGPWSVDYSEEEADTILSDSPKADILVTHSPPFGCLDRTYDKSHLGSMAVKNHIEKNSMPLCVCGHIHEEWNRKTVLDATAVINAGPYGYGFSI